MANVAPTACRCGGRKVEGVCDRCGKSRRRQRGNANKRGYGYRWQKESRVYLRENPLCVACSQANKITAASCVDHIKPHRGDEELFWDRSNWQGLCKPHHDAKTARGE